MVCKVCHRPNLDLNVSDSGMNNPEDLTCQAYAHLNDICLQVTTAKYQY